MQHETKLPQRKIGTDNVPAIGFGLMGMSSFYPHGEDPVEAEKKHLDVLTKAADAGEVFWDTSDMYGPFTNEELVGKWFKLTGRRKEIFLCTKFGIKYNYETGEMSVRGDREYVRECVDASLKRLQTDYIDLYYQHRVDQSTRIEDTVAAMAELVKEGKVKYLGLSECSERTLRRGHAVHPITAVQIEYSLFTLDIERPEIGIKKACDELGIAIVAYSPLGRGMLTGQIKSRSDLKADDFRMVLPRFSEENFPNNLKLVDKVVELANKKGCTPGQLALAWLLKQGDNIIPIPGTKQFRYLQENLGSVKIELSQEENQNLRDAAEKAEVKGERYPLALVSSLFADSA